MRMACLFHYNLDVAATVRFVGNELVGQHRDPNVIIPRLQGIVPDKDLQDLRRILTVGVPTSFVGTGTYSEFKRYQRYGNHVSLDRKQNLDFAMKTLNKEDKRQHVLTFPRWISDFVPNLRLTPGGYIDKPGKNPRLIFDSTFQADEDSIRSSLSERSVAGRSSRRIRFDILAR